MAESPPRDWSARALEAIWLAAAVAVPLAFNPWGGNGFELPKAALLRALILLMGLTALVRVIETRGDPGHSSPHRPATPLLWPALAFGLALILATALSINPRASLWGSYERQQGLLTHGAYLALFLLTATGLRTRAQVERLWTALVWGSAPVVAYGLLQAIGLDPLDWRTDAASPVLSTVGRANFLGSYLVLVLPLTVGRALLARRRWPHLLLLAGQLACLALTQARGAWVGLGAAALTGALAWAAAGRSRRLALAALALAALAVGFVALLNWPDGPLTSLARLPGLDRLAALTRTDAGSTAARLTIWRATLPLVVARPWLGHGPETMHTVFARVFPPQLVYYQGRHVTVDRAHNLWLDLAMSAGLVGIVAFGALLAGFGRLVWGRLSSLPARWERVAWAALAAAVAGHLADLQFGFDLTTSATVFWLTLALGAAVGQGLPLPIGLGMNPQADGAKPAEAGYPQSDSSLFAVSARRFIVGQALLPYLLSTLAVLALIGLLCLRPLLADVAYWKSRQTTQPLEERLVAGMRAVHLWPLEPEYRLGLAWVLMQSGNFAAAEAQLEAADRLSPADPRVWAAYGELYAHWAQFNPTHYADAEAAYARATSLAPNTAALYTGWGLVYAAQGRYAEAVKRFEYAVALDATDGYAYYHLGNAYAMLGRQEAAETAYDQALRWAPELRR